MATVLGIESTAHTFGVGIVREGKVLSNCKNSIEEKMIRTEIEKIFILGKMEGIKISVEGVKSLKAKDD